MKSKIPIIITIVSLFVAVVCGFSSVYAVEPSMGNYTSYPIFQVSSVTPNILIMIDNSGSMNFQAYYGDYDHNTKYYGYFEPYKMYSYASNTFTRNGAGPWDGNFLNWLCMRRVDIARKVLMGGLATSRTGGGNQKLIGEAPAQSNRDYTKSYNDTDGVTPLASGTTYDYVVDNGDFTVNGTDYTIKVQKDATLEDEAPNFLDGNISGVMQRVGDQARWGLEFFNFGTGNNESGGTIHNRVGSNMTNLITNIQNTGCNTWTPLAEAYYVAMQYFKQEKPQAGLDYPNNVFVTNDTNDPYYDDGFVECANSFVLLFTDGASTMDCQIPDFLKDADSDANPKDTCGGYPSNGSNYLDDVTFYARTNDLRSDLDGDQNLIFYTVYAFGNDNDARDLLTAAAKDGGFEDRNGNKQPDLDAEWDADSDGIPDTYFEAESGYEIEAKIIQAINAILDRAASGTAVSVLATSGEGEGNVVQAFFKPVVTSGTDEIKWLGYLQSLWIDDHGNLREDNINDHRLDITKDNIIETYLDESAGETRIKRYTVTEANPYADGVTPETVDITAITPIWEAGRKLAERDASTRKIYTFIDTNNDSAVDGAPATTDISSEFIEFTTDNVSELKPYLGVKDNTAWDYLGDTHDNRANNLINFIRGIPDGDTAYAGSPTLRKRTIDGDLWKLGDIVHSTPVQVSKAMSYFGLVYGDDTYDQYAVDYKNRETVVYVGGNDGMLHAFTCGQYNAAAKQFQQVDSREIGSEIWAYVPQSLLPHLKWLPSEEYTHVYYVDLKPLAIDAKIFTDDDGKHPNGWGTILLCGMNTGGKEIWSTDDFDGDGSDETRTFSSSYFAMDITTPDKPRLLWERSYPNLGLSTTIPSVVKVKDKWYCAIGSGPTDYDGNSTHEGHVFIVDLATGELVRDFQTGENKAFMSSPISWDHGVNYNVDCIYVGETYEQGASWQGKMYRIGIPQTNFDDPATYVDDPNDAINPWVMTSMFDSPAPITVPVDVGWDTQSTEARIFVYLGTGRYCSTADKTDNQQQYIFGIKDPFFNKDSSGYQSYAGLELDINDLFPADGYTVYDGGAVTGGAIARFQDLVDAVRLEDGWYRSLDTDNPSERVVNEGLFLPGSDEKTGKPKYIFLAPSFIPNGDVCGFGGYSWIYALSGETGTAYMTSVIGQEGDKILDKKEIGDGLAATPAVHISKEGVRGLIQDSLGGIGNELINIEMKSGFISWHEHPNTQN